MRRTLKVSTWMLALALVALPVVAVVNGWIGNDRWPLRTLRVNDGLERVDQARLRETVLPFAQRGFFAIKLADARQAVERLPWVERADVRKRWPDVLEVVIVEHRPFARWGEDRLLSEQGRLFPVEGIELPAGLPLLHGPDARVQDVVEIYNESRALFANTGFDVRSVALDPRGSWSLHLANGTDVVVGSQEARLRLRRFARTLPQVLARNPLPLQRADLRYTNGFALTWGPREAGTANPPQTNTGNGTTT
ncbi:MAG: cell division protein FtsQ/DivIB [Luteimonas sp.]|nr:cell division protein FtsQ/DivIB [Luteimonas sp.]